MRKLRYATTATVTIGPFVSKTDGVTPATGETLANSGNKEATLWKEGATAGVAITGAWTHISRGMYTLVLSVTDTNTVGQLRVFIVNTDTVYPVWEDFEVLPQHVYDALITGTGNFRSEMFASQPAAREAVADTVLTRQFGSVSGATGRCLINAARKLVNRVYVSGSIIYVCDETDSMTAWSAAISTSASANPITGVDPNP